jgi:hypothetical protein
MGRGGASTGLRLVVAVVAMLAVSQPRAEDYAACAKIENPLAYNACLARQGPPARATRATAPPADADAPYAARNSARPTRERSAAAISRGRHGRMVLELTIGGGSDGARKRSQAH